MRVKLLFYTERFCKQNPHKEPVDLLTGDKQSVPKLLHPPLVPLPFEPLTKSQILSLRYTVYFSMLD